jgi:hypothetical protein
MRALHRAPKGGALACLLLGALAAPACGLNQEGVAPPKDRIAFPGSVKVDPDGRWLYVVNSNADLRFNAGTVVALDLDAAAADRFAPDGKANSTWKLCPRPDYVREDETSDPCCWDYLDHNILDCDERRYIHTASTIEIGSFGAGSALQSFASSLDQCPDMLPATPANRHECHPTCEVEKAATRGRLYIGVRGNSSLTYIDTARDGGGFPLLTCPKSPSSGSAKDCAVKSAPPGSPSAPDMNQPTTVPDEPYALQLDVDRDLLYVGHLRGNVATANSGGISIFDIANASKVDERSTPPTFIKPSGSVFPPDANGNFGVTSLMLKGGRLYAGSRYTPMATGVAIAMPPLSCATAPQWMDVAVVPTSETYVSPLFGTETRGIQFLPRRQPEGAAPTPERAFVLQRTPPALISFDAAMNEEPGVFGNFPSDVIEVCQAPTFLQKDRTPDEEAGLDDALLYVTCFDQGQVYLIDPRVPRLVGIIDVGRGPAGLEFAPTLIKDAATMQVTKKRRVAYVVGFGSNNVGVLDLEPGSETQYHIIQRLGFPSVTPRLK